MGHQISGLIAETPSAGRFASEHQLAPPTALSNGLSFIALDGDNLVQVTGPGGGAAVDGFEYLTPELIAALRYASQFFSCAYIETEYWGGTGDQGAVVFQAGMITFGPKRAPCGVINEALAKLGVVSTDPTIDAFDHLGLGQYRSNETARTGDQRLLMSSTPRTARQKVSKPIWLILAIVVVGAALWAAASAGFDSPLSIRR